MWRIHWKETRLTIGYGLILQKTDEGCIKAVAVEMEGRRLIER